jgi:site-specific DNA-methyltransferase (adenine-specific)
MPEQLLGRIIRVCSNEGELVLDPFAGSGTTLAVAKKLGRSYLGYELSPQYVTRVKKRLDTIEPGDPLHGAAEPLTSAPNTANGVRLEDREQRRAEQRGPRTKGKRARTRRTDGDRLLWG